MTTTLGETKLGRELGYKGTGRFMWHACVDCGKERWVRYKTGEPGSLRCQSCGGYRAAKYGKDNLLWTGGRYKDPEGYIQLRIHPEDPYFPMVNKKRRSIPEHRLVMAKHLSRKLEPWEIVHHKNRVRDDNRLENLELLPHQAQHMGVMFMEKEIQSLQQRIIELQAENAKLREGAMAI